MTMHRHTVARIAVPLSAAALAATLAFASGPQSGAARGNTPQAAAGQAAAPRFADEDQAAKRKDVLRLLEANGVRKLMATQVDAMTKGLVGSPGMTPEAAAAMKQVFDENFDKLLEMCVQPYMDHLSHADIKELIAFSETPLGKRMAEAQPKIMAETTAAGMKWGQSLQPLLMKRMQEIQSREGAKGKADGN